MYHLHRCGVTAARIAVIAVHKVIAVPEVIAYLNNLKAILINAAYSDGS